ncbi:MAG: hypothetical protein JWO41_306 [Candidatus Saccharibacteria bacterium]|nr:hypothetical protein [Candidatus Saccharibacteria bacterium]
MHKSVLFLSFIGVSLLFITGLLWPDNPAVWLASTSHQFAAVRLVLMGAFGMLLVTAPPRSIILRQGIGLLALVTGLWTLGVTYDNSMKFLDSLALLEFSVCAGIDVLEQTGEEFLQTVSGKKDAITGSKRNKATA